jgi:hypothetical protein
MPLSTAGLYAAEEEEDIDGKYIMNPYPQRRALEGWGTMNVTVKSTACIPFVHGLYIPLQPGITARLVF